MERITLAGSALFAGIAPSEMEAMLPCLEAVEKSYNKGERLMRAGQITEFLGVVLRGKVQVEVSDAWGNVTILETLSSGEIFAHGYACSKEALDIDVVAESACSVALLKVDRIMSPCAHACGCHSAISGNLMRALALRNLAMNQRALATMPKTIRGKVLAYLSQQQKRAGARVFTIPYSQTKLAQYLCVDRSALSAELSKLRKEGVIDYDGATYSIL